MDALISFVSSVVAFSFAAMVFRQFFRRRRPYQAVWALALAIFGAGVAVECVANFTGWTLVEYRLWFLFGATFAAAILGLGSCYLMLPPRAAQLASAFVLVAGAWAVFRISTVPIQAALVIPRHGQALPPAVQAIPGDVTAAVVGLNVFGTAALVGCALWSAWTLWRRGDGPRRVAANALIAAGALIVAGSGSLAGLGHSEYLFLGELAGISIIFAGFLCAEQGLVFAGSASRPLRRSLQAGDG